MPRKYHKIFMFIATAVLLLPLFALAALGLETIYPASPSAQQVITGHTKLPEIIRYAVSWTIIIAALVTAFSLIYAGVQHLTSVGRPEAVKAANERIKKCLLGLLIIASSYLILQTINPQLTIMTIKKQQVGVGIVMFTQAGLYGSDKDASDVAATNWCYTPTVTADNCAAGVVKTACYNPNMVNGFNTVNADTLENLVKAGEARFLSYDISNLTAEFGNMAKEDAAGTTVNFTKFPLYAIGFWGQNDTLGGQNTQGGDLIANTKIFAYSNTQYNGSPGDKANRAIEYTIDGKVGKDGTISNPTVLANDDRRSCKAGTVGSGANDFGMKLITIHDDFAANFNSKVPYYDKTFPELDLSNPPQPITAQKPHPPLSIKVQGQGAGVILYSTTNGGSHAFAASAEDFALSNVKFDNLAEDIEVNNLENIAKVKKECKSQSDPAACMSKSLRHDFLAILHSGYYFIGDLRLFFEKRGKSDPGNQTAFPDDPPIRFPMIYEDKSFTGGVITDLTELEKKPQYYRLGKYCGVDGYDCSNTGQGLGEPFSTDNQLFYYPTDALLSVGNQETPTPTGGYTKFAINEVDQFGRLKANDKASSLELFEIEKKQGAFWVGSGNDNTNAGAIASKKQSIICREVKLCTGKGLLNDCLVFVPDTPDDIQKKYKDYNSIVLPMPLYIPVNIPVLLTALVKTYDDSGATVIKKKEGIEFNDKIKSLYIDGDCAVILFENGINDMDKCKNCVPSACDNASTATGAQCTDCKECWDGGGPGSNSEVFTQSVNDLTTHQISKCGGRERFGFGDRKNCASAIAIFPIKKTEE